MDTNKYCYVCSKITEHLEEKELKSGDVNSCLVCIKKKDDFWENCDKYKCDACGEPTGTETTDNTGGCIFVIKELHQTELFKKIQQFAKKTEKKSGIFFFCHNCWKKLVYEGLNKNESFENAVIEYNKEWKKLMEKREGDNSLPPKYQGDSGKNVFYVLSIFGIILVIFFLLLF